MPTFTLKDWMNISSEYAENKALIVRQIALCGIPVTSSKDAVCHWRVYLVISDSQSVMLDMRPCGAGNVDPMIGILDIDPKEDDITNESVAEYRVDTLMDVSVDTVVSVLRGFGRHHYRFDETGSGCRFWCSIALSDMEKVKIVAAGSTEGFHAKVAKLHEENRSRFPIPIPKGQFY